MVFIFNWIFCLSKTSFLNLYFLSINYFFLYILYNMNFIGGSESFRYFKIISVNNKKIKDDGRYKTKGSPGDAAKKAFTQLSKKYKTNKLTFSIKETTQGSSKKEHGPYLGEKIKLKKPLEVKYKGKNKPVLIKYETKIHLVKDHKQKGGGGRTGKYNKILQTFNDEGGGGLTTPVIRNNRFNNDEDDEGDEGGGGLTTPVIRNNRFNNTETNKIIAIYGQSTQPGSGSVGNNGTLSEALLEWLKKNSAKNNYVILCGPSDEKSEMKHHLSMRNNNNYILHPQGIENKYEQWCGYPFCMYELTLQNGNKLNLVELCETEDFRSLRKPSRMRNDPGSGSGGSLNTFENLLELFACFAYLREKYLGLNNYQVGDIYHCAGSGKAQVARAIHNMLPVKFSRDIGKQQIKFWDGIMEDALDEDGNFDFKLNFENNSIPLTKVKNVKKKNSNKETLYCNFRKIYDDDDLINMTMDDQRDSHRGAIIKGRNTVLKDIYGYNIDKLQVLENSREKLSKMIKSIQYGNPKYTIQFFDSLYPINENANVLPVGINRNETLRPRPQIRKVVDEFMEWGMGWATEWADDKFISYLEHPRLDLGITLFKDRLHIDVLTACKYLAGWNRGDIAKAMIGFYFGPKPESFPQSKRTY
jgi:hypothetical protein